MLFGISEFKKGQFGNVGAVLLYKMLTQLKLCLLVINGIFFIKFSLLEMLDVFLYVSVKIAYIFRNIEYLFLLWLLDQPVFPVINYLIRIFTLEILFVADCLSICGRMSLRNSNYHLFIYLSICKGYLSNLGVIPHFGLLYNKYLWGNIYCNIQ